MSSRFNPLPVTPCRSLEARFLICCSRSQLTPDLITEIGDRLRSVTDWGKVMALASRHRVTPLILRQLTRVAPETLKWPVLHPLVSECHTIARRNLHLAKELFQILGAFTSEGIPAIPLKGPMLAVSAFGDLAWREFDDLDLLIHPHDMAKARKVMESLGFRPQRELSTAQEAAWLRTEHAFHYTRDRDQLPVEIHWRLQDQYLSFHFDTADLWRSQRHGQLFGRSVLCLSPEHLILYLCMHGAKHYWERLEWICSLSAVIRSSSQVSWPAIIEQAARLGGLRILQLGVLLANELEGRDSAEWAPALIQPDPAAKQLAAQVWQSLFTEEMAGSRRDAYRFHFYLSTRERLRDRLSVARLDSIRIPHPDSSMWRRLPLPPRLLFLYYFLGPLRLLHKCRLRGLKEMLRPSRSV